MTAKPTDLESHFCTATHTRDLEIVGLIVVFVCVGEGGGMLIDGGLVGRKGAQKRLVWCESVHSNNDNNFGW